MSLIAGSPSHGYAGHEHHAGVKLLDERLEASGLPIEMVLHRGWPKEEDAFERADTIVIFSDGGRGMGFTGGHYHWLIIKEREFLCQTDVSLFAIRPQC